VRTLEQIEPPGQEMAGAVEEWEYLRLLGLPRSRPLEGELSQRSAGARSWYAAHGRPYIAARKVAIKRLGDESVQVESGQHFTSRTLASRLRSGEAHALLALAVSAGAEVDQESRRLWEEDKPDESYFLDRFGVAVTERLVFWAMRWFCRRSEPVGETVLPHLSPGCGSWDFQDQLKLMSLLTEEATGPGPLRMLPSGMLLPKSTLLAALGVTRLQVLPSPADACKACDLSPCTFRRAPYGPNA
jgi:hypothetical protein